MPVLSTRAKEINKHATQRSTTNEKFFSRDFIFFFRMLECCANTCFVACFIASTPTIWLITIDLLPSSIAFEVQLKLKLIHRNDVTRCILIQNCGFCFHCKEPRHWTSVSSSLLKVNNYPQWATVVVWNRFYASISMTIGAIFEAFLGAHK